MDVKASLLVGKSKATELNFHEDGTYSMPELNFL